MKKIIIAIVITVLSISTIVFGLGTTYFYNETTNAQNKIKNLEDDIEELEDSINDLKTENKNLSSSSNNNYSNSEPSVETEESTYNEQESYSNLKVITYNELNTLIKNKETFILLVSQTYCSHCIEFKPEFNEILKKYSLNAYVLEYNLLNQEDRASFDSIIDITGTPTTTFIQKGIEDTENRIEGDLGEEVITAHLKQAGFIK